MMDSQEKALSQGTEEVKQNEGVAQEATASDATTTTEVNNPTAEEAETPNHRHYSSKKKL